MMRSLSLRHGENALVNNIPDLDIQLFRSEIARLVKKKARVAAFFGHPGPSSGTLRLFAVLANEREGKLSVLTALVGASYPSLTKEYPQFHWFERELSEMWGIKPEGHPWLKPVRSSPDFFRMEGEEVHEVAVGPVHAGIIEPGHFRFQCHGEKVFNLEISLGYQHRGVERAVLNGPSNRRVHYMETLAGDTTIGHTLAYCHMVESLASRDVPIRAQVLRGIMLELERLANHVGDLGALANDVAFLPTASYCGRLRGEILNMTAAICGNRYGRGMVRPGGVMFDINDELITHLIKWMEKVYADVGGAAELLWNTPSVMERFEGTGILKKDLAEELGIVGVAARASGIERDVRFDFPSGVYRVMQIPVSVCESGDVFARAYLRWLEIQRSFDFVMSDLKMMPEGPVMGEAGLLKPDSISVSLVEGWRGEICHVAMTDKEGKILNYKIVDPSFHNWIGLSAVMRNGEISDFPLCNKSFDLSYCGHDL